MKHISSALSEILCDMMTRAGSFLAIRENITGANMGFILQQTFGLQFS
jgi:hypothetical protein